MSEAVTVAAILAGTALILSSGVLSDKSHLRFTSEDYLEEVTGFRNSIGAARKVRMSGKNRRMKTPTRILALGPDGVTVIKVTSGGPIRPVAHSWAVGKPVGLQL